MLATPYNKEKGVYLHLLTQNGRNIAKTDFEGPEMPSIGASQTQNI